jgi:hypothetical protein
LASDVGHGSDLPVGPDHDAELLSTGIKRVRLWDPEVSSVCWHWDNDPRIFEPGSIKPATLKAIIKDYNERYAQAWSAANKGRANRIKKAGEEDQEKLKRAEDRSRWSKEWHEQRAYWRAWIGVIGIAFDIAATFIWLWVPLPTP